ncbi:unnamed protein product [Soboliphyme baturini]|uniref:Transmembrane protein n=1 Tax=Soboliphyme baturini TaxID=241478 RepID=A0A183JAN4_9BILA|nr:unnamed protein product [Soboliphyme baturini]
MSEFQKVQKELTAFNAHLGDIRHKLDFLYRICQGGSILLNPAALIGAMFFAGQLLVVLLSCLKLTYILMFKCLQITETPAVLFGRDPLLFAAVCYLLIMTLAQDTVVVLLSQVVFFACGWLFFMKQLFRDYEVELIKVQLVFSVTFALSCTMFELIIFEIIGFLESRYVSDVT